MPNEDTSADALEKALGGDEGADNTGDGNDDNADDNNDGNLNTLDADGNKADTDDNDGDGDDATAKAFNDMRSEWGRKQKTLEDKVSDIATSVSTLIEALQTGAGQQNQQNQDGGGAAGESGDLDPDEVIPLTIGGLENVMTQILTKHKVKETGQQTEYENSYLKTVSNMGSQYSEKVYKAISERMDKEFNQRHSDNPTLDAQLNFRNAEAALLRDFTTKKINPLKGNPAGAPLGGSNSPEQDNNAIRPIQLDAHAAAFIEASGMKPEDAQKALQGDTPLYLRGKVNA